MTVDLTVTERDINVKLLIIFQILKFGNIK